VTIWDGVPVEALRSGWGVPRLEAYSVLSSTNDRARALAREGAPAFTAVVADAQHAGRGRRGRSWHAAPGAGLLLSIVLPPDAVGGPLALRVGLGAAEGIEEACPSTEVGVKWPNDLWIRGRKVGGILCESGTGWAVAGAGVNVRAPESGWPEELRGRATSLEESSCSALTRNDLARFILCRVKARIGGATEVGRPPGAGGAGRLSQDEHGALSGRDVLRGRALDTESAGPGTGDGITAEGALLLRRPDGEAVRVVAGSVRLR